jgi:pimeloyl-ACP methyl ester carboxylesterase
MTLDDVGDPAGVPLLYLHGTPDSRLARPADDGVAARAGVRLLALDRPGYGGSDALPAGSPWTGALARDVAAVLDELDVERVLLLAWSGGTLVALALAAALPAHVSALGIVAGLVPRQAYDDPAVGRAAAERLRTLELADTLPPGQLGEAVAPLLAPYPCDHALALEHQAEHRDAAGAHELASVAGGADRMADALVEAVRHGLAGVAADVEAQARPLDVDVAAVACRTRLVRIRRCRHAAGVRRVVRPGAPRGDPRRRSRGGALPAVHALGRHPPHPGGGRDPLTSQPGAIGHPPSAGVDRVVPLP